MKTNAQTHGFVYMIVVVVAATAASAAAFAGGARTATVLLLHRCTAKNDIITPNFWNVFVYTSTYDTQHKTLVYVNTLNSAVHTKATRIKIEANQPK